MVKIIKVCILSKYQYNLSYIFYSYGIISWLENALGWKTSKAINFKFWIRARSKNTNPNASSPKPEYQWLLAK